MDFTQSISFGPIMSKVTAYNVRDMATNGGLTSELDEFKFAEDNGYCTYLGVGECGRFIFVVGFIDSESNDEQYYVSRFIAHISSNGLICGEWDGSREYEFDSLSELDEYFPDAKVDLITN